MFAVNPMPSPPRRSDVPESAAIPGGVDAVVIATAADRAPATMREIVDLGIKSRLDASGLRA